MRANELLLEDHVIKMKHLCTVKTNFEDADFWLQRKGSEDTVGTPLTSFSPENIGIKVNRTDIIDSKYLYYMLMHIKNTGYWKQRANGTLKLVHISLADVANIPFGSASHEESYVNEDWQKTNKKDKTDGMSKKAVNAYRKEHPGSKLKTAVTKDPSKLKKGSKDSKRRKSFCARSNGQKKMHNIDCSKTPDKAICKARRRWNCE